MLSSYKHHVSGRQRPRVKPNAASITAKNSTQSLRSRGRQLIVAAVADRMMTDEARNYRGVWYQRTRLHLHTLARRGVAIPVPYQ